MSSLPRSHRYHIPTHLKVPDTFSLTLLGMTIRVTLRQGLILLLGWSTAFNLWRHLDILAPLGITGSVIRIVVPGLLALTTFVFATLQIAGRHPEHWLLVLLHYALLPNMLCWRRLGGEATSSGAHNKRKRQADDHLVLLQEMEVISLSSFPAAGKKRARHAPRKGSVQRSFVDLRAVHHQVLCLATGTSGSYDYVGVLEVQGISYDLKSEEEQRLINDLYQACLSGLSFPIQIMWRALPLNLAPYLAQFSSVAPHPVTVASEETQEAKNERQDGIWEHLASTHVTFIQHLVTRRTLLERKIYLIVRSSGLPTEQQSLLHQLFVPRCKRAHAQALERAAQILETRMQELTRLLATRSNGDLATPDHLPAECASGQLRDPHPDAPGCHLA